MPWAVSAIGMLPMKPEDAEVGPDSLAKTWHDPDGFYGWLTTVQNGPVVNRYLAAAFALFCLSGLDWSSGRSSAALTAR